jgi:hypothetical protein
MVSRFKVGFAYIVSFTLRAMAFGTADNISRRIVMMTNSAVARHYRHVGMGIVVENRGFVKIRFFYLVNLYYARRFFRLLVDPY